MWYWPGSYAFEMLPIHRERHLLSQKLASHSTLALISIGWIRPVMREIQPRALPWGKIDLLDQGDP
jgi:hypothetical protein